MKNNFYPMIFRQKFIKRWGLMRNITEETLSEHSYEVAVLTHALCIIGKTYFGRNYDTEKAVAVALYHDVQEVYTGDMPTPAKYYNESMRDNYRKIENSATNKLLSMLEPKLALQYGEFLSCKDEEILKIVKSADKLSAYLKCVEECKCNNSEFKSAKQSTFNSLKSYACEELEYFIEHYLPAFECDLDELNT